MMPQLANPGYLWLTLFVPLLLWWSLRRRRSALRHPVAGELAGLPFGKARLPRWGPSVLRCLALLLLVLALAGPRWPDLHTRIETEGIAIVMLVDVSGSMAERDFDWRGESITRLDAVKKVFHLFVAGGDGPDATGDGTDASSFQGRPTDQIGLVTFATRPETACPLTLSHSVLLRLLDAEQPRRIPGESETNILDAVAMGLHRLRSAGPRRRVLVLLSDGEHNVPHPQSGWTRSKAAQVAKGLSVPLYTIDAGGSGASTNEPAAREEAGDSPGETRAQAVRTLQELAHITNGRCFQARDTQGLLSACRAIDALERSDLPSFQYRRYHEAYPWFGLAAFVLFSLALGLERTVWRRIP
ncbi:MAG TPA: VWA domain-containing protein [Gemmataceae bacterium]|nr:VWA domain-containing protein [Gemmataceae bacterium]